MAWKGDGSGRKDSERGGVDGGPKGGGGRQGGSGNAGGRTTPKAVGNATVADHAIATGRVSAPSIPSGGVARGNYNSQVDAYNDYAKAVGSFATRGFMDRALDFIGGPLYNLQEPMAGNPRSFAEGSYHSTTNPGGVLGSLFGAAIPGVGSLTGPIMGSLYSQAGLPEIWHGGLSQPDLRNGMFGNTSNPMGGTQSAANDAVGGGWSFGGGQPGPNMGGGNNSGIPSLASINKPVSPPAVPASAPSHLQQMFSPSARFSTGGQYGGSFSRPGFSFWGGK